MKLLVARCTLALTLVLALPSAFAQNPELDAGRRQLAELRARAERLQQQGRHDQAGEVLLDAKELQERLHRAANRSEQAPDLERILHGLEVGIESLRALGRHDARELLERIAAEVRAERSQRREPAAGARERREERTERERARQEEHAERERENREEQVERGREQREERAERPDREQHPEVRAARDQLEVFRIAAEGLVAAQRPDSAELMQLAAKAIELRLERASGDEAQAILRRAPDHAQTTELLGFAAHQLREQGKPDRAERVGRLAEQFGERYRERKQEPQREPERRAATRSTPDVDDLRQQIDELRAELQQLRRALQEQGKRRDTAR